MELSFLGRGAAFNPKEGNTSAFFIDQNQLFLIDCGETVFERLIASGLLEDIETINIIITHTHSDHIGSLGSLVMYSYYSLHKPITIIMPENDNHLNNIEKILEGFGCTKAMYKWVSEREFDDKYTCFQNIRFMKTDHCDELKSYSLLFSTSNGIIYYSGDTRELNTVKFLIESGQSIDKIYIDTTNTDYPGNVHLFIGYLQEIIPKELKKHVYCMHFNNDKCIEQALSLGFNVVEVKESKNINLLRTPE